MCPNSLGSVRGLILWILNTFDPRIWEGETVWLRETWSRFQGCAGDEVRDLGHWQCQSGMQTAHRTQDCQGVRSLAV